MLAIEHAWSWTWNEEWGHSVPGNGWWDHAYLLIHDLDRPVTNMTFVDGHGAFLEMHENPEHHSNDEYDFASP